MAEGLSEGSRLGRFGHRGRAVEMEGVVSKPRQYREAAERKRDPRAWEVEPVIYPFELDESKAWPLPEQSVLKSIERSTFDKLKEKQK